MEKIWYKESGERAEISPIGMGYRNSTYPSGTVNRFWFEKNLQGDIIAIYNEGGTKLVSYTYDAWGKVTTTYHNGGASTVAYLMMYYTTKQRNTNSSCCAVCVMKSYALYFYKYL